MANAVTGGTLLSAARQAYDDQGTALVRVGPLGGLPGGSRLVRVQFGDLTTHGETAGLALRWEAAGPGGRLFPALDADITLAPAGEDAATMTLDGAYRPPLGSVGAGLDRALLHRAATATIRQFLALLVESITAQATAPSTARAVPCEPGPWLPPDTERG